MLIADASVSLPCSCSDAWNKLDFFIVVVSYANIIATYVFPNRVDLTFLLTLRLLRLLRPLRAVRRFPGMRIVVEAVLSCAVPAFNVFLALVLMALIFGILGVSIFGGRFGYCNEASFPPGAPLSGCTGGVFFNTTDLAVCGATSCERRWMKADLKAHERMKETLNIVAVARSVFCITRHRRLLVGK